MTQTYKLIYIFSLLNIVLLKNLFAVVAFFRPEDANRMPESTHNLAINLSLIMEVPYYFWVKGKKLIIRILLLKSLDERPSIIDVTHLHLMRSGGDLPNGDVTS